MPPAAAARADESVTYTVTLTPEWLLHEEVCFTGPPRARVMPELAAALPFCVEAVDAQTGASLVCDNRGVDVRALATGCVRVTLDLRAAARELDDDALLRASGPVLVGSPDVWLWRPEPWPEGLEARLTFHAPADVDVSLPFAVADDGRFIVPRSTWRLASRSAFGRLDPSAFDAAGARFSVAQLGRVDIAHDDIAAWISSAARAVGTVSGRFPLPRVQILLAPVPSATAVPFGMMVRGGGASAMLLVSANARRSELVGEWVGVHELAHLLLPPLTGDGVWLAEGSASYFQQTLRSRVGLLDEATAWQGLVDGFGRGRAQAGSVALGEACASMHKRFSYQHVYWGGAAILLLLDVELRKRGSSLDAAVAAVRTWEPADTIQRSPAEVLDAMQRGLAGSVADFDVRAFVDAQLSQPFADVEPTLAQLGVQVRGRRVVLDPSAPLAALRRGIAGARGIEP